VKKKSGPSLFRAIEKPSPVVVGGGAPPKGAIKGAKRSAKGSNKGQEWCPQWVTITTSYDDDDNKEVDGFEKEHVVVTECDFKREVRQPNGHFKKLLEATYPNHAYPIKHKAQRVLHDENLPRSTFDGLSP
jgi:hypothetical protein